MITADVVARSGLVFNSKLPAYYCGHWLWLEKRCWRSLYSRYEPYMGEAIRANLSPGAVFWDVGANIGFFSLYASRIIGAKGRVIAFEPSPDVFALLSRNAAGNDNISILPRGIGNTDGMMVFTAQGTSTSASFVAEVTELTRDRNPGQQVRAVNVQMCKIDSMLDELPAPSLVKIDVDGDAEYDAASRGRPR